MEKPNITEKEQSDISYQQTKREDEPEIRLEGAGYLEDKQRARRLVRRIDLHLLPLCAWIYLLNYLDRLGSPNV